MIQEDQLREVIYNTLEWTWKPHGCRSSKRTDYLHKELEDAVLQLTSTKLGLGYNYVHETKVPTANDGTFKIDILASDSRGDLAYLVKFIGSSYNKNRNNYANTEIGEALRFLSHDLEQRKVCSLNILPLRLPYFYKGSNCKVEKLNKCDISYVHDLLKESVSRRVHSANLYFEVDETVLEAKTRTELRKRLEECGPQAIRIVNYGEFINKIEKSLSA
jgi:hypothetical protein